MDRLLKTSDKVRAGEPWQVEIVRTARSRRPTDLLSRPLRTVAAWIAVSAGLSAGMLSASGPDPSPPGFEARLERHVVREMELNQIPGLSLAMVRAGKMIYGRGFGVRDLVKQDAMELDTPVELASLSKSMTALAVLLLVRDGKIDLDSPLKRYLPGFQTSRPQRSAKITIRHLLEHRSGLTRDADRLLPCCGQPEDKDLKLAVRRFHQAQLPREPGTSFRYANSNYILSAAAIKAVSRRPFSEFMNERIFRPLGMHRTTLDLEAAQAWGPAPLHERIWGSVRLSSSRYRGRLGSSAVKSTARDMVRFMGALLDETHPLGALLSAPRLCQQSAGYQFGWHVESEKPDAPCRLVHSGKIWGANTAVILVPALDLGVVVLINSGVKRAEEIAAAAVAYHLEKTPPGPAAMAWSAIPDNWAMLFLLCALLVLSAAAGMLWRTAVQLRSGERHFLRELKVLAIGRSALLVLMSAVLLYNAVVLSAWSRPDLPSSAQTAFPLFAVSVALLLLLAAILGLAPKR